jgi:arylsulfatase A-like enzyme
MSPSLPNVLIIIADDQAPHTIGRLGEVDIQTPNLDRLCAEGVYLSPYTTVPVCTPGRGEFLTGCNALQNGCPWFNQPIKSELQTLPMYLRSLGYHTCHIGKWHNDGHPSERGFDESHLVFPGDDIGPYAGHQLTFQEQGQIVSGHSTELFGARACSFLQRAPKDQPWFCYVALHSPHDPRTAPEPWASMYRHKQLPPLPPNFMPEHPFDTGDMMIRDERLADFPRGQDEIRRHRSDYYAMISHHDYHIGLMLDQLRQSGQYDNTLIVFTADHGLACGSHGLMGKENLYEHSARVPLVMAGPGIPMDRRLDRDCLCGHYDFLPTLADYLGQPAPQTSQGISYWPVLQGQQATVRSSICAAYRQCIRMATDGRFKLIWYPHIDRYQLFDLHHDPHECNDLLLPWRRHSESRGFAPTMRQGMTTYDPDPDPIGRKRDSNNILYEPSLPAQQVDRIGEQLNQTLEQWLNANDCARDQVMVTV